MKNSLSFLPLVLLFSGAISLAACGGGGSSSSSDRGGGGSSYSGATAPAAISTDAEAEVAAEAAAEAANYGLSQHKVDDAIPLAVIGTDNSTPLDRNLVEKLSLRIGELATEHLKDEYPMAANSSVPCTYGGTISFTPSSNPSSPVAYNFNNCKEDGATINGKVTIHFNQDGSLNKIVYHNVRVYDHETGQTHIINTTLVYQYCGGTICGFAYQSVFTGSNGTSYRVSNLTLEEQGSDSFTFSSAEICDANAGCMSIETTQPITYCDNGYPSSGKIKITSGSDSATVTFSGCEPTSVSVSYSSPDGSGTYDFSIGG